LYNGLFLAVPFFEINDRDLTGLLNTKVHSNRLSTEELIKYIAACEGKGPVTINIEIYQDGTIGEESLAEMEKIKQQLKKDK